MWDTEHCPRPAPQRPPPTFPKVRVGVAGWVAVAAVVVVVDAYAKACGAPTMSDVFARNRFWSYPAAAAVGAHLFWHEANR